MGRAVPETVYTLRISSLFILIIAIWIYAILLYLTLEIGGEMGILRKLVIA